jgi:hypothetical protein
MSYRHCMCSLDGADDFTSLYVGVWSLRYLNLYKHETNGGVVKWLIKIHKTLSCILVYQDYLLCKLLSPCDFPSGLHPTMTAKKKKKKKKIHENVLRTSRM